MNELTPGRWKYVNSTRTVRSTIKTQDGFRSIVVARLPDESQSIDEDRIPIDGRLIASAKELLYLVKNVLKLNAAGKLDAQALSDWIERAKAVEAAAARLPEPNKKPKRVRRSS